MLFALPFAAIAISQQNLQPSDSSVAQFLAQFPDANFSPLYKESLQTFITAEDAYKKKDYTLAANLLDAFWQKHPPGTKEWVTAYQEGTRISRETGIMVGHPPSYNALQMLTECTKWRTSAEPKLTDPMTVTMTIVIVGESHGTQPTSFKDSEANTGVITSNKVQPAILQNDFALVRQSYWLFTEYAKAATNGQLDVQPNIVSLPDLKVPFKVTWSDRGFATLDSPAWASIWNSLPEETLNKTDWWWVIYPSAVPEQFPDFKRAEFVTGGMGTGPDGNSPCFIVDDKWLTRRPPHLGQGTYTDIERRSYLPQWFQHEFFHHLFRIYPEFGLEKEGHDWFNKNFWPKDFEGELEPDFYTESLNKRFKNSQPSLATRLLYSKPDNSLYNNLNLNALKGDYLHEPKTNGWHSGKISLDPTDKSKLRWTNEANVSWLLTPDFKNGRLLTGPDCPYYTTPNAPGSNFQVIYQRDANGRYTSEFSGFTFNGTLYRKVKQ